MSGNVDRSPELELFEAAKRLNGYLAATADLLMEHADTLTTADRDDISAAVQTVGRHLIWVGQRVPGFHTPEPVTIAPPDLPVAARGAKPAHWIVDALRHACECLRTMGYGLVDHRDDDGQLTDRTLKWIKQTMAAVRSQLDHLSALAAEAPFSDASIAEVSGEA